MPMTDGDPWHVERHEDGVTVYEHDGAIVVCVPVEPSPFWPPRLPAPSGADSRP